MTVSVDTIRGEFEAAGNLPDRAFPPNVARLGRAFFGAAAKLLEHQELVGIVRPEDAPVTPDVGYERPIFVYRPDSGLNGTQIKTPADNGRPFSLEVAQSSEGDVRFDGLWISGKHALSVDCSGRRRVTDWHVRILDMNKGVDFLNTSPDWRSPADESHTDEEIRAMLCGQTATGLAAEMVASIPDLVAELRANNQ